MENRCSRCTICRGLACPAHLGEAGDYLEAIKLVERQAGIEIHG